MATQVKVQHLDAEQWDALYCHYAGQINRQHCYVTLDLESGKLTAEYDPEIGGGVSMDVWAGIVRRYCMPLLSAAGANDMLDAIAPIAERVLAYAEIVERNCNREGRVVGDIEREMEQAIIDHVNRCGVELQEMDADDWLTDADPIPADASDEDLDTLEADYTLEAHNQDIVLYGLRESLIAMRDAAREANDAE